MAHEIIDAMISPEGGAYTIRENGTGVANRKAFDLVEPELLTSLGLNRNPESVLENGVNATITTQRRCDCGDV